MVEWAEAQGSRYLVPLSRKPMPLSVSILEEGVDRWLEPDGNRYSYNAGDVSQRGSLLQTIVPLSPKPWDGVPKQDVRMGVVVWLQKMRYSCQ